MKIKLSPVRLDTKLAASVSGDSITVNGNVLDFSQLPEGATLPFDAIDSDWIADDVSRVDGEIHLTLVLPHGTNAPHETRFPAAFESPMTVIGGEVPLPPHDKVQEVNSL